jgi:hypothetical protein
MEARLLLNISNKTELKGRLEIGFKNKIVVDSEVEN